MERRKLRGMGKIEKLTMTKWTILDQIERDKIEKIHVTSAESCDETRSTRIVQKGFP